MTLLTAAAVAVAEEKVRGASLVDAVPPQLYLGVRPARIMRQPERINLTQQHKQKKRARSAVK